MTLSPEWIVAICAAVTLLILWSTTIIGGALWLMRQLKDLKTEILNDFNEKHQANAQTVKALESLVIRHDVQLNPEFNGSGRAAHKERH